MIGNAHSMRLEPGRDDAFVARMRSLCCARVARAAGVRCSTIYEWLADRKGISRATYDRLVDAMNRIEPPPAPVALDYKRDAELIARIRVRKISRVARAARCSPKTITAWINGYGPVSAKLAAAIIAAVDRLEPAERPSRRAERMAEYYRANKHRWATYDQRKARKQAQQREVAA